MSPNVYLCIILSIRVAYCFVGIAIRIVSGFIVLERYFRFESSLLSILCMLIARMEMGTSRVSGDSDIIGRVVPIMMM